MSSGEVLNQYEQLKTTITELELPKGISANLTVQTTVINIAELAATIDMFSPSCGWVQYSDEVVISAKTPSKINILEGQFCNVKNDSLHIKLQQGSDYLVTRFIVKKAVTADQFYTEQPLIVRSNLKEQANLANYRIWWQLEKEGVNEGRWLPLAQQFLGFNEVKNKEEQ